MEPVKFVALDRDDLEVVSTHLQDALVKVCGCHLAARRKSGWSWRSAGSIGCAAEASNRELRRCRSALRFERVNACKCRNVDPAGKDAVLNLLAVEFSDTDPPAGVVILIFSGGGVLRLEVECLEAELADLGPSWPANARPIHVDEFPLRPPRLAQKRRGPAGLTACCVRAIEPGSGPGGPAGPGHADSSRQPRCPILPTVFAPFSPPSVKPRPMSKRPCARSSPRSPPAATAPSSSSPAGSTASTSTPAGSRSTPARDRDRLCRLRPQGARRARARARTHRGLSPPATAARRALHRRARGRARAPLDRDRGGRTLCPRRYRRLSVLGADECGAGQGRRACRGW